LNGKFTGLDYRFSFCEKIKNKKIKMSNKWFSWIQSWTAKAASACIGIAQWVSFLKIKCFLLFNILILCLLCSLMQMHDKLAGLLLLLE
jgi:hypothetical protein